MFGFGKPKAPPKTPAEVLQDHIKEAKKAELAGDWATASQQYSFAKWMVRDADTHMWTKFMDRVEMRPSYPGCKKDSSLPRTWSEWWPSLKQPIPLFDWALIIPSSRSAFRFP